MRIVVGSINPTKVRAVENVMKRIYGDVEVLGVEVENLAPTSRLESKR